MPISNRPHKRVLLTQPTALPDSGFGESAYGSNGGGSAASGDESRPVRVVAYLTQEESEQLDALWLRMRSFGVRPSKADIMRAALVLAVEQQDTTADRLVALSGGDAAAAARSAVVSRRAPAKDRTPVGAGAAAHHR